MSCTVLMDIMDTQRCQVDDNAACSPFFQKRIFFGIEGDRGESE